MGTKKTQNRRAQPLMLLWNVFFAPNNKQMPSIFVGRFASPSITDCANFLWQQNAFSNQGAQGSFQIVPMGIAEIEKDFNA